MGDVVTERPVTIGRRVKLSGRFSDVAHDDVTSAPLEALHGAGKTAENRLLARL